MTQWGRLSQIEVARVALRMLGATPASLLWGCGLVAWTTAALAQRDAPTSLSLRGVVFFPPVAPVYGAVIDDRPISGARLLGGRRLSPPDGLADFVCEDFYPALSTRLFVPELKPPLESRLHGYRAKRLEQVTELLNQFVTLHDVSTEEREHRLREFAVAQTPQLVALELEGERLREELIGGGIGNVDWNAGRRWQLGAIKTRGDGADAEAEFQVARATAFYQKGLVPQQRGLVREIAFELQAAAHKARGLPSVRSESDAMFFSPETARFRLPSNISSALRDKIAGYNGQKAALKRELRETITEGEGKSATERTRMFDALADRQWPQLRTLEELAEEIRGLLGPSFEVAPPPPPPWLPAGLMQTIQSYNEDRDSYFGELKQRMETASAFVPRPEASASSDDRLQQHREYVAQQTAAKRRAASEFQREHEARFRSLEQRYKAIRDALSVVAEKQTDRKTGRPLDADTLLRQYGASMAEFDTFGREAAIYTHYRIAMLQPGLSSEQRRLLFGYALVGLAQPLPGGELMPRRSATRPYPSF